MMKAKNLAISKEQFDAIAQEHAVNSRFWNNPKSIHKLLQVDAGSIITVAPPVNKYYESKNGGNYIEKSSEALEAEKRQIHGRPTPIVAFGNRVKENWGLETGKVYYALLKAGMESHKVFYLNNVKFASFDEFAILALIGEEDLPKFSLEFKAAPAEKLAEIAEEVAG